MIHDRQKSSTITNHLTYFTLFLKTLRQETIRLFSAIKQVSTF